MAEFKLDPVAAEAAVNFVKNVFGAAKEAALDEVERHVHKGVQRIEDMIDGARTTRKKRRVEVHVSKR